MCPVISHLFSQIGSLDARFPRLYNYKFVITLKDSGFKAVQGSISSLSFTSGIIIQNTQHFEDEGYDNAEFPINVSFAPGKELFGTVRLVDGSISDVRTVKFVWEADDANAGPILLEKARFIPTFSPASFFKDFYYDKPIESGKAVALSAC